MIEVERKYLVKNNSYKMQAQRAGLIVHDNDFVSEQDEYSSKEVKFY